MAYPKLLSPLTLGNGTRLANRCIMGSMHTGLEEGEGWGHRLTRMAAFFEERARGGVGLMVTGGIAPNNAGRVAPMAAMMTTPSDAARHREITDAVHAVPGGSKIAMQILHSGRYGYHPSNVSASPLKAPIGWFTPRALSSRDVEATIDDFVRCACLAEEAGCVPGSRSLHLWVPAPLGGPLAACSLLAGLWLSLACGSRSLHLWVACSLPAAEPASCSASGRWIEPRGRSYDGVEVMGSEGYLINQARMRRPNLRPLRVRSL
jgi:2,4-dienoyl-CoA reductase-like NADH-dependent reductase (Old Yellow Enzyme family)